VAFSYTTGEVAVLLNVASSTVHRLIAQRELAAYRMPTQRRDRHVRHSALVAFVRRNPAFRYALDRLDGYDPSVDSPAGPETEPPPPPVTKYPAPPRSPQRPRSAKYGKIPRASHYCLTEVAFCLGLSRQTVWEMVRARKLVAIQAPSPGPRPWRWLVPHAILVAYIRRHPAYLYALGRIRGCDEAAPPPTAP
jgi:excisionase family DNA binding protein